MFALEGNLMESFDTNGLTVWTGKRKSKNYYNFQREGNFEFLSSVEQAHF